ncbi:MAG TPA: alpha/beta fold hydrolase [Myxococcota bacterium]|jgi:pimeloyl-ACP methyl ester carboxylesterase|nr:alpha/beta fold hydrolase [Myxococcota bacterium]
MPHVVVQGRKVYYEEHGPRAGSPFVLVMGLGGSCRGWLPLQVPDFSKHYRTIVFDNRGVGGSDDPGGSFTTADMADDLAGLLDALSIPRAHVMGIFMGAMIGQELALRHPQRVAKLVLVGTYARPDAKRRMLLAHWRELARGGLAVEHQVRERLLWVLQDETLEQTDLIESMIAFFTRDGAPLSNDVFVRQCDACLAHDTHDRLRDVACPTLVVCGRNDQLTPPKLHRELADEIPGARLVTFSYGGHIVAAESAERLNHLVLQFLAE